MSNRAYQPREGDDTPQDAGSVGIRHAMHQLRDREAWFQLRELRNASREIQIIARVRLAALSRRVMVQR